MNQTNRTSRISKIRIDKYSILDFFLLVIFLELVFPPITVFVNSYVVTLACIIFWFIFSFFIDRKFYLDSNIHRFYLFILILFMIAVPYLFGKAVIGNRYSSMILVVCGNIIYEFYKEHGRLENLKRIILFSCFFALITLIITYFNLLINPYVSRSIKSEGDYSKSLAAQGIGGYHFIYFVAAASIPILFLALRVELFRYKLIYIITYILMLLLVVRSNYLTAFLLMIICSIILFIFYFGHQRGFVYKISLCVFGIILMIGAINLDEILLAIADILPERISRILISDDMNTFDSIFREFTLDRFPTIMNSIEALFAHPFFGLIGSSALGTSGEYLTGFGQHSYIFDTFALYGIVIGIINFFAILKPFKKDGRFLKHNASLSIAMAIFTVSIYLFNNATASIGIVICIIYPWVRDNFI